MQILSQIQSRIWVHANKLWIRIWRQEVQKLADPTDLNPVTLLDIFERMQLSNIPYTSGLQKESL
jgi:hypothetical protein